MKSKVFIALIVALALAVGGVSVIPGDPTSTQTAEAWFEYHDGAWYACGPEYSPWGSGNCRFVGDCEQGHDAAYSYWYWVYYPDSNNEWFWHPDWGWFPWWWYPCWYNGY